MPTVVPAARSVLLVDGPEQRKGQLVHVVVVVQSRLASEPRRTASAPAASRGRADPWPRSSSASPGSRSPPAAAHRAESPRGHRWTTAPPAPMVAAASSIGCNRNLDKCLQQFHPPRFGVFVRFQLLGAAALSARRHPRLAKRSSIHAFIVPVRASVMPAGSLLTAMPLPATPSGAASRRSRILVCASNPIN